MGLLNEAGVFHAYPTSIGIDETGPNNLATCIVSFQAFERFNRGQTEPLEGDGQDITAWFYLEKKDGSVNDFAVKALREAFGWDGRDPFWLQDNAEALAKNPVQITTDFEEYAGKTRLKVQWLNPYGSTGGGGGVTKADGASRTAIKNRLGSKLRANAGGSPVTTPKPAAPKPAPKKPAGPVSTLDEAWAVFAGSEKGKKLSQADLEKEWFRILAEMFPGRDTESLTPAEWGRVQAEAVSKIVPF